VSVTSPVFEVQHFPMHDVPGIRTTVFLRGCALRSAWGQNPEGQEAPGGEIRRSGPERLREPITTFQTAATRGSGGLIPQ